MFVNLIDKIIFGVLLVLMFQIPILSDHYLQYLSGYYASTRDQVDGINANARQHDYPDAYAMIDDFRRNPNSAVRYDAEQKQQTMLEYQSLARSVAILQHGYFIEKIWFMANPAQWHVLRRVLENFRPGIPLNIADAIYAALIALILNLLVMLPLRLFNKSA